MTWPRFKRTMLRKNERNRETSRARQFQLSDINWQLENTCIIEWYYFFLSFRVQGARDSPNLIGSRFRLFDHIRSRADTLRRRNGVQVRLMLNLSIGGGSEFPRMGSRRERVDGRRYASCEWVVGQITSWAGGRRYGKYFSKFRVPCVNGDSLERRSHTLLERKSSRSNTRNIDALTLLRCASSSYARFADLPVTIAAFNVLDSMRKCARKITREASHAE